MKANGVPLLTPPQLEEDLASSIFAGLRTRVMAHTEEAGLRTVLEELRVEGSSFASRPYSEWKGVRHDVPAALRPTVRRKQIPREHVVRLADSIRDASDEVGWPRLLPRGGHTRFDRVVGGLLHETLGIERVLAANSNAWNVLSLLILPDVAVWRYPDLKSERIVGKAPRSDPLRHVFGRLWWAVEVLGPEAASSVGDDLGPPLGEDEIVSIMERRDAISSIDRLASRAAREGRKVFKEAGSRGSRMDFFRALMKEITRRQALINVLALDGSQLDDFVAQACQTVLETKSSGHPSPA